MRARAAAVVAIAAAACSADPVGSKAVDALGPESANGPSAFHRAGQPCGTCHVQGGAADTDFSIAGTVFAGPDALVGVAGATIDLVDAAGTSPPLGAPVVTNCVGNFYVLRSDWNPAFPVEVRIRKGEVTRPMVSPIGHAASCADCHKKKVVNPLTSVGHVYLFDDGRDPAGPSVGCPISPEVTP